MFTEQGLSISSQDLVISRTQSGPCTAQKSRWHHSQSFWWISLSYYEKQFALNHQMWNTPVIINYIYNNPGKELYCIIGCGIWIFFTHMWSVPWYTMTIMTALNICIFLHNIQLWLNNEGGEEHPYWDTSYKVLACELYYKLPKSLKSRKIYHR